MVAAQAWGPEFTPSTHVMLQHGTYPTRNPSTVKTGRAVVLLLAVDWKMTSAVWSSVWDPSMASLFTEPAKKKLLQHWVTWPWTWNHKHRISFAMFCCLEAYCRSRLHDRQDVETTGPPKSLSIGSDYTIRLYYTIVSDYTILYYQTNYMACLLLCCKSTLLPLRDLANPASPRDMR